jgi:hypothetical protein
VGFAAEKAASEHNRVPRRSNCREMAFNPGIGHPATLRPHQLFGGVFEGNPETIGQSSFRNLHRFPATDLKQFSAR